MLKLLIKKIFKKLGFEIRNLNSVNLWKPLSEKEILRNFEGNGKIPWNEGYEKNKSNEIKRVLKDKILMNSFKNNERLNPMYGYGVDERIVEYPWLFSRITKKYSNLLDAGSSLNHDCVIGSASNIAKKMHILTLNHEKNCFIEKNISYIFEDIRNLPFRNGHYDLITCISTLEHIGCDNEQYAPGKKEHITPKGFIEASKELIRVLKTGGNLYITVPFGQYMNLGMAQQFDSNLLNQLLKTFDSCENLNVTFYKYDENGWNISRQENCLDSKYVTWLAESWMKGAYPKPMKIEKDHAAGARAVACIEIKK